MAPRFDEHETQTDGARQERKCEDDVEDPLPLLRPAGDIVNGLHGGGEVLVDRVGQDIRR